MYNPTRFQSTDFEDAFELMEQNPFATVITVVDGKPFISHVPLTRSIVGFQIQVKDLQFKKKLSQNRTPADRAGVLKGLPSRTDNNSQAVLREMLKIYSPEGEKKERI